MFNAQDPATISSTLTGLHETLNALSSDVQRFSAPNDQSERRALRSIFSYIEGSCVAFRLFALSSAHLFHVTLSQPEILAANDITYHINDCGNVKERGLTTSFAANIQFSVTLLAKSINAEYELSSIENAAFWQKLKRSHLLRNRLTHPKLGCDMEVSDKELSEAIAALEWFKNEVGAKLFAIMLSRLICALEPICVQEKRELARTAEGKYNPHILAQLMSDGLRASEKLSHAKAVALIDTLSDSFIEESRRRRLKRLMVEAG